MSALVLAAVSFGWIPVNAVNLAQAATYVIVGMAVLYFLYFFIVADLTAEERRRGIVLVPLFVGSALFCAGYGHAGSSLDLFGERYADRTLGRLPFPAPTCWERSPHSAHHFIFAPLVAGLSIA